MANLSNGFWLEVVDTELHAVEVAKAAPKRPGGTVLDSPICAFLAHGVQLAAEMKCESA